MLEIRIFEHGANAWRHHRSSLQERSSPAIHRPGLTRSTQHSSSWLPTSCKLD